MTNAHIELHWKSLRSQMAKIPKSQQWPAVLLGHRHQQTRRQAKEILVHSLIPNLKFGGKTPSKTNKHTNLMDEFSGQHHDKKIFRPTSAKKRKTKGKLNESFDGSKEKWGPKISKSNKNDTYMKRKNLDHSFISSLVRQKTGNVRVTGISDEAIILDKRDVDEIMSDDYISDTAVSAGLLLLDKRINNISNVDQDKVHVYSISACRLILNGELEHKKKGRFITVMARNMVMMDFNEQQDAIKKGKEEISGDGGHFTLISNLFCADNECNVYETFEPYRNPRSLLKEDGKRLLRSLCNAGDTTLKVKCIDVNLQEENECGPLAFGLALQLCFYYHEGGLNSKLRDVRKHLLSCLKANELVDFPHTDADLDRKKNENILFTLKI